ncbi:hypothetical protein [Streptomyces subrutilus]|uniref:hypothetical protein n=1 Tax=Streptomyces subrutilus TaxID=36818 RepID=UPI0033C2843D
MSAIERAPAPVNAFDRYPVAEWAAQGRHEALGNMWSSVSIANVTGLTFDRIEAKFITDWMITGRREAEVRLAAFRHDSEGQRWIVSASRVLNLHGLSARNTGVILFRWIHGIPFGWDYEENNTVYTIELQHRYRVGPQEDNFEARNRDIFVFYKNQNQDPPFGGGALEMASNNDYDTMVLPKNRPGVSGGWMTVHEPVEDHVKYGSYSISAMHYCVGLPKERIPEATSDGWIESRGLNTSWGRAADLTEEYLAL